MAIIRIECNTLRVSKSQRGCIKVSYLVVAGRWHPIKESVSTRINVVNFFVDPIDDEQMTLPGIIGNPFRVVTAKIGSNDKGAGIIPRVKDPVRAQVYLKDPPVTGIIRNEYMIVKWIVGHSGWFIVHRVIPGVEAGVGS